MTFKDKINNSDVLMTLEVQKGKDVKNKKSRIIGIILSIFVAILTIFTTVTKKYYADKEIDIIISVISIVLAIMKIIFSIVIAIFKKSVFSLNHYRTYRFLEINSNFILLLIFIINMYNVFSSNDLQDFLDTYDNKFNGLIEFYKYKTFDGLMLALKVILAIPLLIKFISFTFRNGGRAYIAHLLVPIFPIFLFKFLFRNNRIFFEYKDEYEDYYVIYKRRINTKNYGLKVFLIKLLLVVACFLVVLFLIKSMWVSVRKYIKDDFFMYLTIYMVYGLVINLIYLFDNKDLGIINKRTKELDKLNEKEENVFN